MNIGDRLLNYEILAVLGKGGFGTVYLARDVNLDVNVAVKVMNQELTQSETMLNRLRTGARAAARLRHANIQTVHFLGRDPVTQSDFVVMEYLSGGSLRQRIAVHPLPTQEALAIFTTICNAVDFAHQHGVIHRDLKPDNIMFGAEGRLVVTDFDLARITSEASRSMVGQTLGTLLYISPEQARGDDIDHTTDIYSLGVMLFELMTGRWPFMGDNPTEILKGHLYSSPPRPSEFNPKITENIDDAVLRALAKSSRDRIQSATELACLANDQLYAPQKPPELSTISADEVISVTTAPTIKVRIPEAWLCFSNGAQAGQRFPIGKGVSIGYGKKKNDIHLDDPYVSRAHARVDRQKELYELMDLKSKNGTKVNGKKIEPYVPTRLTKGDQIEVGDTVLVFEMED